MCRSRSVAASRCARSSARFARGMNGSCPDPAAGSHRPRRHGRRRGTLVERAGSEARLHPPAHLVEVDPQRAQRLGIALAQATPAHQPAQRHAAGFQGDTKIGQHAHPGRLRLGKHAEQQMLGAQPRMAERSGLFLSANNDLAGRGREPLEHRHLRPCFLCTACLLTPSA